LQEAGEEVLEMAGRLRLSPGQADPVREAGRRSLPRRLVAFDLESIVRPVVKEQYREQHVFQVGAVCFGPDEEWVAEQSEFNAFTALRKEADELLIYRDELRARYHAEKRPLADVLEEFRAFCAGADAIVANNGVAHDFHLIDEEYARCDLEPLLTGPTAPRLVDALYLAQALSWRSPPAGGRSARRSAPGVRRLG